MIYFMISMFKYCCTERTKSLSLIFRLVWFGLWCLTYFQQYFSYIVVVSFIGGGNRSTWRKPPTCHKSLTNFITWCCIEYTSPWSRFEITTLVVIGNDCMGSCKSNYYTTKTTMAPYEHQHRRKWYILMISMFKYSWGPSWSWSYGS